ncbi:MAG TPA: hypothetical protein VK745_01885 [Polyangiaceae bacterium]|jgi:hypothetical protein|nr:hypothetical protein [Polyangiaceae bacterium]
MRELETLSLDRTLRDAARDIDRRTATQEPLAETLPKVLFDEETLAWLRELRGKDPLAEALERWLLRVREHAQLEARRAELTRAHRIQLHAIVEPEQTRLSLSDQLRLSLARPQQRAAYLRSYFASSADLAELVSRLWEERQLFADQLGAPLDSFELASTALAPTARNFLAETRAAYETLDVRDPERLVTVLLAESAEQGWPARLSLRTVSELLPDPSWLTGLRLRPFSLPVARSGSSFLLALAGLGRAVADAASAARSPFVLARDVFDLERQRVGALFGLLPISATFTERRLGAGSSQARDHLRALARAVLADARVAAFRVLLRELLAAGTGAVRRELAELSHGALGFELPREVAGAFIRVRPRDSQRFAGLLLAASRQEALVEAHDDDWFRNPRAIREIRAELDEPRASNPSADALSAGLEAFRARIEPLL